MASVVKKKEIVEDKEKHMLDKLTIEPHNIIMILNYSWGHSFIRVISNKKAIAERGCFPYNHSLMTYPIIRSSITKEDVEAELTEGSDIVLPLQTRTGLIYPETNTPTFNPKYLSKPIN